MFRKIQPQENIKGFQELLQIILLGVSLGQKDPRRKAEGKTPREEAEEVKNRGEETTA
jgi:hypothetical protein